MNDIFVSFFKKKSDNKLEISNFYCGVDAKERYLMCVNFRDAINEDFLKNGYTGYYISGQTYDRIFYYITDFENFSLSESNYEMVQLMKPELRNERLEFLL